MLAWIVVGVTCGIGLVVTVVALLADGRPRDLVVLEPPWFMPTPSDIRAIYFPRAWRGYHPDSVDVFVNALTAAYQELYELAGPELVAQARQRLARRVAVHAEKLPRQLR